MNKENKMAYERFALSCSIKGDSGSSYLHGQLDSYQLGPGKHFATFINSIGQIKGPFLVREGEMTNAIHVEAHEDSTYKVDGVGYTMVISGHLKNGKPYSAVWSNQVYTW